MEPVVIIWLANFIQVFSAIGIIVGFFIFTFDNLDKFDEPQDLLPYMLPPIVLGFFIGFGSFGPFVIILIGVISILSAIIFHYLHPGESV